MSQEHLEISERSRNIGGFEVGRLLPYREKRMVGPFIYMDHMGPASLGPEKYLDVDQHPHIGLSTLTYLIEGEIEHRDSLGNRQLITPGDVNWMIAGSGVTHTERTPANLRDGSSRKLHGYQIWVALPDGLEDTNPEFHHIAKKDIPGWKDGETSFKLIAGQGFGRVSPVPVLSEMFFIEMKTDDDYILKTEAKLAGEVGFCIVQGEIEYGDLQFEKGKLLVSASTRELEVRVKKDSHIFIIGGEPFENVRNIHWNFVSSDKDKIEAAKKRWQNHNFPKVPGDRTYVPF